MFGQVREKKVDLDSLFSNYVLFYYFGFEKGEKGFLAYKRSLLYCKGMGFFGWEDFSPELI